MTIISDHDPDDVIYEVKVEVVAQLVNKKTGEVIIRGSEHDVWELYETLRNDPEKENEVRPSGK